MHKLYPVLFTTSYTVSQLKALMRNTPLLILLYLAIACTPQNRVSYLTHDARAVITADSTGIYAHGVLFSPYHLFPKEKWHGDYIWLNKAIYGDYQDTHTAWINNNSGECYRALFRKTFYLEEIPSLAILSITADVSFRAYVNGKFVCQGPANIGSDYEDHTPPEHWFFTVHDVKDYLQTGKNIIAVEVYSFDMALSETTSGEGKFICDVNVNLHRTLLHTDSTWKCNLDTCLSRTNDGLIFNAAYEIPGWEGKSFDDSDWPHASLKDTTTSGYLIMSHIPTTIRHPLQAAKIWNNSSTKEMGGSGYSHFNRELHDESFTLDFGRNISAYYHISLTAHAGDTVALFPREKAAVNRPFVYICKEGKNTYTTPQLNVFRYLTVNIAAKEGLKIDTLYALYSSYPLSHAGSFTCSDTFYTKLWDISRWTTQLCMNSLYLDSPGHQEPIACTGDYLIESLSNYYVFGDPWLARQDLMKTARMLKKNDYDMFHTSYSLLWVQMLFNYFQHTGDTLLVKELLPYVNHLNDLFATYLDEQFLLSQAPDYMFMDWIKIGKFNAHHPPAVIGTGYLSAFYHQSLIHAAYFNKMNGNDGKSRDAIRLAEKIKNGINEWLWDEKKGIYRDGIPFKSRIKPHVWLPADEDMVTYSPHMNALAVLYDIAPKDNQAFIMEYVIQQKETDLQPYFMYFVLSALAHIDKFDAAGLPLLYKWENGIDLETYTLKENWQDRTEFGYTGDFSHAWGGSPLYFMSSIILGITPEKPGYEEIRFVPYVSDHLLWAQGTVPLNEGNRVFVFWERSGQSSYTYHIMLPKSYSAILYHPARLQSYGLRINRKSYGKPGNPIVLSRGDYTIEYTKIDE